MNDIFNDLEKQYKILSSLSNLALNNNKLSNDAKAYILTGDKKWEESYDATSIQYDKNLDIFYRLEKDTEVIEKVRQFDSLIAQLKGVELLILSKVRSGDSEGARGLFDGKYEQRQSEASSLILGTAENKFVDVSDKFNAGHVLADTAQNGLFLLFFSAFIGLTILSFRISFVISAPIKALADVIKKIAGGDLKARAKVTSKDEIGILAMEVNEMTARLEKSYQDLEENVNTRTRELEDKVTELENLRETMLRTVETLENIKAEGKSKV